MQVTISARTQTQRRIPKPAAKHSFQHHPTQIRHQLLDIPSRQRQENLTRHQNALKETRRRPQHIQPRTRKTQKPALRTTKSDLKTSRRPSSVHQRNQRAQVTRTQEQIQASHRWEESIMTRNQKQMQARRLEKVWLQTELEDLKQRDQEIVKSVLVVILHSVV